jgi:hypothetical protein
MAPSRPFTKSKGFSGRNMSTVSVLATAVTTIVPLTLCAHVIEGKRFATNHVPMEIPIPTNQLPSESTIIENQTFKGTQSPPGSISSRRGLLSLMGNLSDKDKRSGLVKRSDSPPQQNSNQFGNAPQSLNEQQKLQNDLSDGNDRISTNFSTALSQLGWNEKIEPSLI